jgi:hypothetical protein
MARQQLPMIEDVRSPYIESGESAQASATQAAVPHRIADPLDVHPLVLSTDTNVCLHSRGEKLLPSCLLTQLGHRARAGFGNCAKGDDSMPDDSYMKDTPETDRDMRVILERLMVAYPAAVPVAHLAATIGKTENRISHYGTRIRSHARHP